MRSLPLALCHHIASVLITLASLAFFISPANAEFTQGDGTINNMGLGSIPYGTNKSITHVQPTGIRLVDGSILPLDEVPVGLSRWIWTGYETYKPVAYQSVSLSYNWTDGFYYLQLDTPLDWSDFWVATATPPQFVPAGTVNFTCQFINHLPIDPASVTAVNTFYQQNPPACQPGAGAAKGAAALGRVKILPGSIVALWNVASWCGESCQIDSTGEKVCTPHCSAGAETRV
jgi:hypothetical protein